MRKAKYSANDIRKLDNAGMIWKAPPEYADASQALSIYRSIHDTALVPRIFTVPSNDRDWPAELG